MLHGIYCVGCCWALMALLFVGGVMNRLWIAAIAILVLGEKVLPRGAVIARTRGSRRPRRASGWCFVERKKSRGDRSPRLAWMPPARGGERETTKYNPSPRRHHGGNGGRPYGDRMRHNSFNSIEA